MTEPAEEQPDPKPQDGPVLIKQSEPIPQQPIPPPWGEDEATIFPDA